MPIWVCFLLIVFFIAMNAFFVTAEFAAVRVRKSQIDIACDQGKPGSKAARFITDNVNSSLAVCQLGITIASLAIGWLGEPTFAAVLGPLLGMTELPYAVTATITTVLAFILMTFLHVVVGEQIPKALCLFNTEGCALGTAGPLRIFYKLTYPIVVLFTAVTNAAVRLLGYDPTKETEAYSGEEIKILIDESTEEGMISENENEFVGNIFDMGDRDAESIMTPRTDLVCVDLEDSIEQNKALILQYKYTRYPVCQGNKDRIVGFVHVKDLCTMPQGETIDDLPIRPIKAVPESLSIPKLLQVMQDGHSKIAVVVDEHGGTAGIVTMSDVVEQIIGRVDDEYLHDTDEIRELGQGVYDVEGSLSIAEFVEILGFEPKESAEVETAAGLIMAALDRIPTEGESTTFVSKRAQATVVVTEMDGHRVERMSVSVEAFDEEEDQQR